VAVLRLVQVVLLFPYLAEGLALPMVLAEPGVATYARDLATFGKLGVALLFLWLLVAVPALWLARRGPAPRVNDQADWKVIFPATVRLFALGAPLAFIAGGATGCWLAFFA
jgi:hypothetical protein